MQKNIQVGKCEVIKSGNTNDKDWTIYKVFVNNDDEMKEFTTFNDDFISAEGQQMQINVMFDQKYSQWKEISKKQEAENSKHDEIMNALKEIWNKLDDKQNDL